MKILKKGLPAYPPMDSLTATMAATTPAVPMAMGTPVVVAGNSNNKTRTKRAQQAQQTQQAQSPGTKVCSYFKRHGGRAKGHNWQDCRALKRQQNKKKKKKKRDQNKKRKNADAQIAEAQSPFAYAEGFITEVSSQLPNDGIHSWKLDTCATAHMTSDIGKFHTITPQTGVVRVGGNTFLPVESIGSVILNTALPDGTASSLRLDNVPSLHQNLFSWIVVKSKAVLLAKDDTMHIFRINDLVHPILLIDIRDKLPWLREATNNTNTSALVANNPNASALVAHTPNISNLSALVAYNPNISSLAAHTSNMSNNANISSISSLAAPTPNTSDNTNMSLSTHIIPPNAQISNMSASAYTIHHGVVHHQRVVHQLVFFEFLDRFESNHHSSGLKTPAGLGKWCGEVGTTLGAEVRTWSMKS